MQSSKYRGRVVLRLGRSYDAGGEGASSLCVLLRVAAANIYPD